MFQNAQRLRQLQQSRGGGGNPYVNYRHLPPLQVCYTCLLHGTYTAKVKDETVPCVEALPGHRDLCRSDCSPAFDLQKPLHSHFIGNHMSEARSHATSLRENEETTIHTCAAASEKIKSYRFAISERFLPLTGKKVSRSLQRASLPRLGFCIAHIYRYIPAIHSHSI